MDQVELDPTGRSAHEPGAKLDAGKNRPALVLGGFANALSAVTAVGTYGAKKYTDNGWRTVPDGIERYSEAMLRHWLQESKGELHDSETELLHAAHLAWNALARLELMLSGPNQERQHAKAASRGTLPLIAIQTGTAQVNEWRNDRPPTKGDTDDLGDAWVWDWIHDGAFKIHGGSWEPLNGPWMHGNAPCPTQSPKSPTSLIPFIS